MTDERRYGTLPDIDSAPETYETASQLSTEFLSPRSSSPASSYKDFDDATSEPSANIDRAGLRLDAARSRFSPAQVDASNVSFSDKITDQPNSYRVPQRRLRRVRGAVLSGHEGSGALEEDETLEERITRLQREVEEVKAANESDGGTDSDNKGRNADVVSGLGETLASLRTRHAPSTRTPGETTPSQPAHSKIDATQALAPHPSGVLRSTDPSDAESPNVSRMLAKSAEIEDRIASLEVAIGSPLPLSSNMSQHNTSHSVSATISSLEKQLSFLTTTSLPELDALGARIEALAADARALEAARTAAHAAAQLEARDFALSRRPVRKYGFHRQDGSPTKLGFSPTKRDYSPTKRSMFVAPDLAAEDGGSNEEAETLARAEEQSRLSQVDAIYATLPTFETLSPLLPHVLERLRTLRLVHVGAAEAAEMLAEVERAQARTSVEIEQWEEGLRRVEKAVSDGEALGASNTKVVEQWVRELETRLEKLSVVDAESA